MLEKKKDIGPGHYCCGIGYIDRDVRGSSEMWTQLLYKVYYFCIYEYDVLKLTEDTLMS